jgi:HD-GYP domain-containing protein (c-di-GMP phosphodiesterase class II)
VAAIVRCVHEHWNGSGYPAGLTGEEIPLASRIILPCAAYDAMVQDRPYRKAFEPWTAVRKLRQAAGVQFDPAVIDVLTALLREERLSTPSSGLPAIAPRRAATASVSR